MLGKPLSLPSPPPQAETSEGQGNYAKRKRSISGQRWTRRREQEQFSLPSSPPRQLPAFDMSQPPRWLRASLSVKRGPGRVPSHHSGIRAGSSPIAPTPRPEGPAVPRPRSPRRSRPRHHLRGPKPSAPVPGLLPAEEAGAAGGELSRARLRPLSCCLREINDKPAAGAAGGGRTGRAHGAG